VAENPHKEFYRLSEVCQFTETQPYVLRFWENEFPELGTEEPLGGRRLYRKADIALIRRIKQLLEQDECSLEEARLRIQQEAAKGSGKVAAVTSAGVTERGAGQKAPPRAAAIRRIAAALPPRELAAPVAALADPDRVERRRYDDALEEIEDLRLQLREAERLRQKAEAALSDTRAVLERRRAGAERASELLESVLERLDEI
jgi:DNA-binding transcriptional MerR regulator